MNLKFKIVFLDLNTKEPVTAIVAFDSSFDNQGSAWFNAVMSAIKEASEKEYLILRIQLEEADHEEKEDKEKEC